jgi:hypothetical protein
MQRIIGRAGVASSTALRPEKVAIKKDDVPDDRADKPAKRSQKDIDVRWTKKHG